MDGTKIEAFYKVHQELNEYLVSNGEPSFASESNDNFRRSLVLAIASFFEKELCDIVRQIPLKHAGANPLIVSLIEQKAITRQYHTWFKWELRNANTFFKLFGDALAKQAANDIKAKPVLEQAVRDFLTLGETRNMLVHQNYVTFDVDKSPSDIIGLFRSAIGFIQYVNEILLESPAAGQGDVNAGTAAVSTVSAVEAVTVPLANTATAESEDGFSGEVATSFPAEPK